MMTDKKTMTAAAALLILSGCIYGDRVGPREQYWTTELGLFLQEDRSLRDLHSWLRDRDVRYTFEDGDVVDGYWRVPLERIAADGLVCESWQLYLDVAVDPSGDVRSHSLEKAGVCL